MCYSRNGNRFFNNPDTEAEVLRRTARAIGQAGLWDDLDTDWLILDCEVMPWNLKAGNLLRFTYAPVGAAAAENLKANDRILKQARERDLEDPGMAQALLDDNQDRLERVRRYRSAYRATAGAPRGPRTSSSPPSTCWPPRAAPSSTWTTTHRWRPSTPSTGPIRPCSGAPSA